MVNLNTKFISALLLCLMLQVLQPAEAQQKVERSQVLISFSVPSIQNPALHEFFKKPGLKLFQEQKKEGLLKDYRILINMLPHSVAIFDVGVIIDIGQPSQLGNLATIESRISEALLAAGFDENMVIEADVLDAYLNTARPGIDASSLSNDDAGLYVIAPHVIDIGNLKKYRQYADEYLLPIMDAYVGAEALNGFTLYINSYPAGSLWQALLVFKFSDFEQLDKREKVQAQLREQLIATDEVWKQWYEQRYDFRSELRTVLASPVIQ